MKQSARFVGLSVLAAFLVACPQTAPPVAPEPEPPPPNPTTFPVTEVSGTLPNWTGGDAYLTLVSGYSVSSGGEEGAPEVVLGPPTYGAALSAAGTFTVQLGTPATADLTTLTCGAETYLLGLLTGAVTSSVPEPTQGEEFLGGYTLGPADSQVTDAVWVYSAEALDLDASCTLPGSSLVAVTLNLEPGWNQALITYGPEVRLESGAVPTSFVWSEF